LGSGGGIISGASGNTGIGTTTPAGFFTIAKTFNSGTADCIYLSNPSQTGVTAAALNFINVDSVIKSSIAAAVFGNDYMTFNVGSNTERMRITSAGYVGIGITQPSYTLEIASTNSQSIAYQRTGVAAKKWGFLSDNDSTYWNNITDSVLALTVSNSGSVGIGTTSANVGRLSVYGQIYSTSDSTEQIVIRTLTNTNRQLLIGYSYTPNYAYIQPIEQSVAYRNLALNPFGGNVGIGTTDASYRLYVLRSGAGILDTLWLNNQHQNIGVVDGVRLTLREFNFESSSTYGSSNNILTIGLSTNKQIALLQNGNVGIGGTAPNSLLEVNRTVTFSSIDTYAQLVVKTTSGANGRLLNIGVDETNSLSFIQSLNRGTDTMPLSLQRYGGNVGIGNTSFSAKLHVTGNILSYTESVDTASLFISANSSYNWQFGIGNNSNFVITEGGGFNAIGTTRFTIVPNGEVWIGYTSDQGAYLLQVNGSVYASAYFESSDVRLKNIINSYSGQEFGAIEYTWKDGRDSKNHWGYSAQEVMKYIPDAVEINKNGFYTLDYNQAHTYKISMLEKQIKELKEKMKN
jgi:hypothetical protein